MALVGGMEDVWRCTTLILGHHFVQHHLTAMKQIWPAKNWDLYELLVMEEWGILGKFSRSVVKLSYHLFVYVPYICLP